MQISPFKQLLEAFPFIPIMYAKDFPKKQPPLLFSPRNAMEKKRERRMPMMRLLYQPGTDSDCSRLIRFFLDAYRLARRVRFSLSLSLFAFFSHPLLQNHKRISLLILDLGHFAHS